MINSKVEEKIQGLINLRCVRQVVGNYNSLSLGFGKLKELNCAHGYREWELGSFSRNWRIIQEKKVICGGWDGFDIEIEFELDSKLKSINLGCLRSIYENELGDVSVHFDNSIVVEFFCLSSSDEDMFYIFCPNAGYIEYNAMFGWLIGRSDLPFPN